MTQSTAPVSISERLEQLAGDALSVAKKAKRNRKSLAGDNFYANKMATLRADATNAFKGLAPTTAGDTSAIAELIEAVFSPSGDSKKRLTACRELCHNLRTVWRSTAAPREDEGLFPLNLLAQTRRGYLVTVGRQMNGTYGMAWFDAAAVLMRRLLEISIIEAFEAKGVESSIKDTDGNYVQLSGLVSSALCEPSLKLSRNSKKALPKLKNIGHMSAHGRYFTAQQGDLSDVQLDFRVVIEELLKHAGLL